MAKDKDDKPEDLTTAEPLESGVTPLSPDDEEPDIFIEETTRADYITAAWYALDAVAELDPMTPASTARINRIRRKSLAIIDTILGEFYDELFNIEETDD